MGTKSHQAGRSHGRAQSETTHRQHNNDSQISFAQRAAAAQSRFLEGSMNDRISAVPPPAFLGPDDAAAYEQQFYKPSTDTATAAILAPAASQGNRQSVQSNVSNTTSDSTRRSFFAPLWDGVRAGLHTLGRARSASTIRDNSQRNSSSSAGSLDDNSRREEQGPKRHAAEAERPTGEEVMANYRQLVDSGFFSAHAIQSTRHAHPAATVPPPQHAPPPVPTTTNSSGLTENLTSPGRRAPPAPSHAPPPPPDATPTSPTFSLFPRTSSELKVTTTATRQPRHAPPPCSFTPLPTIPSISANLHHPSQGQSVPSSPARGTERARSSADDDTTGTTASGARKLVKKLRKSTGRFGDLRSSKTNAAVAVPPLPPTQTAESSDVEMTGVTNGLHRSFSSSRHPDNKTAEARPRSSAGKLLKRRRGGSTGGQDANPLSSPTYPHSQTLLSPPSASHSPRPSYDSSASSAMSPTAAAFHYPAGTRTRRVSVDGKEMPRALRSVQPDGNRGVPDVPAIPVGMFKFGVGDDVENLRYGRVVK